MPIKQLQSWVTCLRDVTINLQIVKNHGEVPVRATNESSAEGMLLYLMALQTEEATAVPVIIQRVLGHSLQYDLAEFTAQQLAEVLHALGSLRWSWQNMSPALQTAVLNATKTQLPAMSMEQLYLTIDGLASIGLRCKGAPADWIEVLAQHPKLMLSEQFYKVYRAGSELPKKLVDALDHLGFSFSSQLFVHHMLDSKGE